MRFTRRYRVTVYKSNVVDGDTVSDYTTTNEGEILDLLRIMFAINHYLEKPLALVVEVSEDEPSACSEEERGIK